MNRWGLAWMDEAIRLDDENKELKRLLMQILLWIGQHEGLALLASAQIEKRWGVERERAA